MNREEINSTEIRRLENNLYQYLRHTQEGRASVNLLFRKAREIEEKLSDFTDYYNQPHFRVLEDVFAFIDQLQDPETRQYIELHRNEIQCYTAKIKGLLG